ncbi:RCC1 and BTB domain-containing protein 1, partial [Trachymyrmex septentrionalis]
KMEKNEFRAVKHLHMKGLTPKEIKAELDNVHITSVPAFATGVAGNLLSSYKLNSRLIKVYAWGSNNNGQMGLFVHISCCNDFTMAVTRNDKVYGWGRNNVGQLGVGNHRNKNATQQTLRSLSSIISVKVTCEFVHTLALTDKENIYAWGGNMFGQLGIGNQTECYESIMVNLCQQIEQMRWIDITALNNSKLFDLANAYFENNLKKQCIRIIKQGITVSDVAYFYSIAVKYNIEELEEFCVQLAVGYMTTVVETENFAKLDQNLMKTFIIKTSKAGCFKN